MSLNILMKTQECTCGAFKTSPLRFYGQLNWPLFIVYPEKLSKNSCNLSIRFLNFVTIYLQSHADVQGVFVFPAFSGQAFVLVGQALRVSFCSHGTHETPQQLSGNAASSAAS